MYCTEPGYKGTEVEVWKEANGTTLRKYYVNADGTRNMSALDTVKSSTTGNQTIYQATVNQNSLVVNTATGISTYTLYVGGNSFPLNLTCQSYL